MEILEKCRQKGRKVPDRLDPMKRNRGIPLVEDGPITCVPMDDSNVTELQAETEIVHAEGDEQQVLEGEIVQVRICKLYTFEIFLVCLHLGRSVQGTVS